MCIKFDSSKTAHRHGTAFSLIELMIGVTVLTIMFLALFSGISYGFMETQLARENLRATQVMLEKMEGIRLYTFDQLIFSNMFPKTFTNQYYPLPDTNRSQGVTYYGELSYSNLSTSAAYNDNTRLVTVKVNWTNQYGVDKLVPRHRQMQTIVTRWGIQNYLIYDVKK